MPELGTKLERTLISATFRAGVKDFPDKPTLPQMTDALKSYNELLSVALFLSSTLKARERTAVLQIKQDGRTGRVIQLPKQPIPRVVSVRLNSPMEVVVMLSGSATAIAASAVVTARVAQTLLSLIRDVGRVREEYVQQSVKKAAADVLKQHLKALPEEHYSAQDWRRKSRRKMEDAQRLRQAERAALALSILTSVQVKEE